MNKSSSISQDSGTADNACSSELSDFMMQKMDKVFLIVFTLPQIQCNCISQTTVCTATLFQLFNLYFYCQLSKKNADQGTSHNIKMIKVRVQIKTNSL